MPLYLDEIWFTRRSPEQIKQALSGIQKSLTTGQGLPRGVSLVAGPWYSNEELKLLAVLNMEDHSWTYSAFSGGIASGMIERRRLSPIVEWKEVEAFINQG